MSDQEDNNPNNEDFVENYEENENIEINQGEEEYEEGDANENGEEEGQDVYAFDIQINEDSYLLVIGKNDENKLLLRLIDKEDENKPFFQNDFSLEDLRNLNPFFNNIDDENIAFQYIISNLNDADKEIKIVDQDKINLSISINDEGQKIDISFVLFKTMNDFEGEGVGEEEGMGEEEVDLEAGGIKSQNEQQELIMNNEDNEHEGEGDIEEGAEIMNNIIEAHEGEDHIEKGAQYISNSLNEENENNIKKSIVKDKSPLQVGEETNITSSTIEKKEITKKSIGGVETVVEKKEIIKTSNNQNQGMPQEQKEITIITKSKIEPDSKSEIIISNKGANMEEVKTNENNNKEIFLIKEELLNTINALNENFNNQLLKQNESILKIQKEKEVNENKIMEMKNELIKKDNDLNDFKNKFELINKKMIDIENNLNENKKLINDYEGKINAINNKVDNINEKIVNINVIINEQIENNNKKIKADMDSISKQINEKMTLRKSVDNEPKQQIENNYDEIINELSSNIQGLESQIVEIKNELNTNKNNNDSNINIFNDKIVKLQELVNQNNTTLINIQKENKTIKENQNVNANNNEDINNINNRLNDFDQIINDFNSKFQYLEENINNKPNVKESQTGDNDNLVNDKLSAFENKINDFGLKINNLENNLKNTMSKKESQSINNEKIINTKLSTLENAINGFDSKIINLENSIKNNNQRDSYKKDELNQYNQKINEVEKLAKNIEKRINNYEIDNIIQNMSMLMEKQNDTELYDKINNLEIEINDIKQNEKKPSVELRKSDADKKMNLELNKKITNIENILKIYENEFQKIENDKLTSNNYRSNLDKKTDKLEKRIANVSEQSDDLNKKTGQLFNITKKLENLTKELDKKTSDIIQNMNKVTITKEVITNTNPNMEKLMNIKKKPNVPERNENNYMYNNINMNNINRQIQYNDVNINNNGMQANNGYKIKTKEITQKSNYGMDNNQYNNINPNKRMVYNKNYVDSNYVYSNQTESNHIESKIVNDNSIGFLINRIREMHPKINNIYFNLAYRATEDGDTASDFHKKCDKIGPNITLIKTKKGYIFGGFTFKNWEHMARDIDENKPNLGSASRDARAFGFSVSIQKIYNNEKPNEFAIWCNRKFGPTFKNNLFQIFDSCLKKGGYCSIRSNSHFGGQLSDYEISGGESRFKVEELEVYEVRLH